MRPRRKWTTQEDNIIRSQPNGTLSIWKLEKLLRAKTETIELRAQELGVDLRRRHRKRPRKSIPNNDLLLQKLQRFHPERKIDQCQS